MAAAITKKKDIPEQVWMRCEACGETVFRKLVVERLNVCPECNHHYSISARTRIALLADEGTFVERHAELAPSDPLGFKDRKAYRDRLKENQGRTGLKEAAVCGTAAIEGMPVVLCVMDSRFIGGSMGSVVGEKVVRSVEDALEMSLPLIVVCASGGARMMEGVVSLMQMARTSAALARLDDAGELFISVLTDPTTGGVTASFAMLADVILAEPKARIGFAGPRVLKETIRADLPPGFQTSEFLLDRGFVDRVVPRSEMKNELARLIRYCSPNRKMPGAKAPEPRDDAP